MEQDLAELFAELDVAKDRLQRSVKRSRKLIRNHQPSDVPAEGEKPLFDWPQSTERFAGKWEPERPGT